MATEAGRHQLYEKISTEWGRDNAEELMSYLPPVGWADVATKQDLDTQTALLRSEMAQLGSGLRTEMAQLGSELRTEMAQLGSELRTEMAQFGIEIANLNRKVDGQGEKLRVEMHHSLVTQTRWILTVMVAMTGVFAVIVNWLH